MSADRESCPELDHLRETAQATGSVPGCAESAISTGVHLCAVMLVAVS